MSAVCQGLSCFRTQKQAFLCQSYLQNFMFRVFVGQTFQIKLWQRCYGCCYWLTPFSLAKQSVVYRKSGPTHSLAKGFEFPSYMSGMRLMFGLVKPLQWHLRTEVLHVHKGNNDLTLPRTCPCTQCKKSFSKMLLSYCWTEDHSYVQDTFLASIRIRNNIPLSHPHLLQRS